MAFFPSIQADFGAVKTSDPKIRTVKFGDGYEQRIAFGINQDAKKWALTFKNLTETDSDTIETFLEARAADSFSFSWSPPDESATYSWVCDAWSKTLTSAGLVTINATFRQVFEP